MWTKIKICGCKRKEDIELVNKFRPDYVVFVFAPSSRRVSYELAKELKGILSKEIQSVGVFVNEPLEQIITLCNHQVIDVIQLHGDETSEYIKILKKEVSQSIIKAVRVISKEQIQKFDESPSDFLLLDTFQKGHYGGGGIVFDWSMIPKLSKPYFLAGGIHAGNVKQAVNECRPYGIDLSSGVEVDGFKNEAKIRRLMHELNEMNNESMNQMGDDEGYLCKIHLKFVEER